MFLLKNFFTHKQKKITLSELKDALHNEEFVFYYQPEWELKTNKIIGVEALVRWQSPSRGYVPPMQFISLLENSELMPEFSKFLFKQTIADLKQLHRINPNLFMAINLSVSQLQEPNLLENLQKNLAEHDIDPKYMECELTESQELNDDILANGILEKMSALHIPVSIDDFGTGYSSFDRLKKLNISKIKIDLSFIRTLLDDPKNQAIVASMIKLGHDLGFPVLAEGIETTAQQKWLKSNGCDLGQGYWFSHALPLTQLIAFLQDKTHKK